MANAKIKAGSGTAKTIPVDLKAFQDLEKEGEVVFTAELGATMIKDYYRDGEERHLVIAEFLIGDAVAEGTMGLTQWREMQDRGRNKVKVVFSGGWYSPYHEKEIPTFDVWIPRS